MEEMREETENIVKFVICHAVSRGAIASGSPEKWAKNLMSLVNGVDPELVGVIEAELVEYCKIRIKDYCIILQQANEDGFNDENAANFLAILKEIVL